MEQIIWRDDDISHLTSVKNFEKFKWVQEIFDKYEVTHTIAVIAKDIEKSKELIKFINEHNIDVQLHCWEHIDYSKEENKDKILPSLIYALDSMQVFHRPPTIIFPPWNRSSDDLVEIAATKSLKVSYKKASLQGYIKAGGDIEENVINFHYWAEQETMFLEQALRIYIDRQTQCL